MRKTIVRRLEALEAANRAREEQELSSLTRALNYIWIIVLAYYLGDLRSDEDPFSVQLRALKFVLTGDFVEDIYQLAKLYKDACRRLFAKARLDFDATPSIVLFEVFVTMVNQLPDQWLKWLHSNLRETSDHLDIPAGSNLPRQLAADNFLWL